MTTRLRNGKCTVLLNKTNTASKFELDTIRYCETHTNADNVLLEISSDIDNIEIYIDGVYTISVGKYNDKIEVFELHHGAEFSEDGYLITDGELWQYKLTSRLGDALNYALSLKWKNDKPIKIW